MAENVENMKQIEVKTSGRAEFEFDMKLKDANSKIYLYKVSSNGFYTDKKKQCYLGQKKNI